MAYSIRLLGTDVDTERAAAFYRHFGFTELPGQSGRWMLPKAQFA